MLSTNNMEVSAPLAKSVAATFKSCSLLNAIVLQHTLVPPISRSDYAFQPQNSQWKQVWLGIKVSNLESLSQSQM